MLYNNIVERDKKRKIKMLYGMNDEELGLVKKEKLNIKKVILVIAIIIIGFLI